MKFRLAAITVLIICSLYGCGNNRDTTNSIYTPAPITPRPTFDTTRYRTEEEITAKQDEDFVIYDSTDVGGYPSVQSEFDSVIVVDNEAIALAADAEDAKYQKEVEAKYKKDVEAAKNAAVAALAARSTQTYTDTDSDTPVRSRDSIPEGFSSKDYPYSVYSSDGRTYLGKITTDTSDPESIWNPNGIYGSSDSDKSIFNPDSYFGSTNSMFSAFNDNASAPPKILDNSGNMVGELSTNLRIRNAIDPDELKYYAADNGM